MRVNFNESMEITVDNNIVKMVHDLSTGYEFEVEVKELNENKARFLINYIYDKGKNRKMKSQKLTKKYSKWVTSILIKCKEEGLLQLI